MKEQTREQIWRKRAEQDAADGLREVACPKCNTVKGAGGFKCGTCGGSGAVTRRFATAVR